MNNLSNEGGKNIDTSGEESNINVDFHFVTVQESCLFFKKTNFLH